MESKGIKEAVATPQTQKEEQGKPVQKQKKTKTEVFLNELEASYLEEVGVQMSKDFDKIFCVENFAKKKTARIDSDFVKEVDRIINFWKQKKPKAKIIHICQFNKGTQKSKAQLTLVRQAHTKADNCCFYEANPYQSVSEFDAQLKSYPFTKGKEKYVVLEIEASDLWLKLSIAQQFKIENFIFIAGEYGDVKKWGDLLNKVRQEGGKSTVLLTKRYHITTKESYIKNFVGKADEVVHGKFPGFVGAKVLFLDKKDLVYKTLARVTNQALESKLALIRKDLWYKFSRLDAIEKANIFAKSYVSKKVV